MQRQGVNTFFKLKNWPGLGANSQILALLEKIYVLTIVRIQYFNPDPDFCPTRILETLNIMEIGKKMVKPELWQQ